MILDFEKAMEPYRLALPDRKAAQAAYDAELELQVQQAVREERERCAKALEADGNLRPTGSHVWLGRMDAAAFLRGR